MRILYYAYVSFVGVVAVLFLSLMIFGRSCRRSAELENPREDEFYFYIGEQGRLYKHMPGSPIWEGSKKPKKQKKAESVDSEQPIEITIKLDSQLRNTFKVQQEKYRQYLMREEVRKIREALEK